MTTHLTDLPAPFLQRLQHIMSPAHYQQTILSMQQPKHTVFRLNPLSPQADQTLLSLQHLTPQPFTKYPASFTIPTEHHHALTHSHALTQGELYIQNPSSLWAAHALHAQPGEEILDLCAAPGSKTSAIACAMHNTGRLAAVEKNRTRFFRLQHTLRHQHITCAHLYLKDGRRVGQSCPERFDRVLVDAPCSSESRFHLSHPERMRYWSTKKMRDMASKQWPLLDSGFRALKPGGRLIYSTCSFAPEENEHIVNRLLLTYPEQATLEKTPTPEKAITQQGLTQWTKNTYHNTLDKTCRIIPDAYYDGFYMACITKLTSSPP